MIRPSQPNISFDGADVPEDAGLVLRGVDIPEPMERDKSGMEPAELLLLLMEVSAGRELRAADMAGHSVCIDYG